MKNTTKRNEFLKTGRILESDLKFLERTFMVASYGPTTRKQYAHLDHIVARHASTIKGGSKKKDTNMKNIADVLSEKNSMERSLIHGKQSALSAQKTEAHANTLRTLNGLKAQSSNPDADLLEAIGNYTKLIKMQSQKDLTEYNNENFVVIGEEF